jgi:hypothetical protein
MAGDEQLETASKLINNILADSVVVSNPPQRKVANRYAACTRTTGI